MLEPWARSAITISSDLLDSAAIAAKLGLAGDGKGRSWGVELESDSTVSLDDQISGVKVFLRNHMETLKEFAGDTQIRVNLSWTPRQPQDGIALDPELLGMLSMVGATVLIDTYLD